MIAVDLSTYSWFIGFKVSVLPEIIAKSDWIGVKSAARNKLYWRSQSYDKLSVYSSINCVW